MKKNGKETKGPKLGSKLKKASENDGWTGRKMSKKDGGRMHSIALKQRGKG